MFKILLGAVLSILSTSALARNVPADITVKCSIDSGKNSVEEVINIKYGAGQKRLTISGLEEIIVAVSDNNAMEEGLHDVKLYAGDLIISAKSVSVSADQTHGVHVVRIVKNKLTSIYCGI